MTSIIDRYIAATNDGFPGGDQAEVERDVRAALNDIVEARMDDGLDREEAERAAVEELGDPKKFAAQFRRNPRYLVGPELFGSWWFIMRTLLFLVTPIVVAITAAANAAHPDMNVGEVMIDAVGSGFNFAIHAFFWVTLTYLVVERVGVTPETEGSLIPKSDWSIDDLPEIETGRQIGKFDLVFQIVPVSLFAWYVYRLAIDGMGALGLNELMDLPADLPAFNPQLSVLWLWGLIILVIANVLVAVWSFMVGNWTRSVTVVNVLLSAGWIGFFALLVSCGDILNPEIQTLRSDLGDWSFIGKYANNIILGIVVLIGVWDIWESMYGHVKYLRQRGRP